MTKSDHGSEMNIRKKEKNIPVACVICWYGVISFSLQYQCSLRQSRFLFQVTNVNSNLIKTKLEEAKLEFK